MNKKITIPLLLTLALLAIPVAQGLGELAGRYIFNVSPGQTATGCLVGSTSYGYSWSYCNGWGLLSDENQTITVTISAEGEGAKYLNYPKTVDLPPNRKMVYVNVTATIPSDYSGNKTMNATLYALQGCQAKPSGGFGICFALRMAKSVFINVTNYEQPVIKVISTTTTTTIPATTTTTTPAKICAQVITKAFNPITGEKKTFPNSCIPDGWKVCTTNSCYMAHYCQNWYHQWITHNRVTYQRYFERYCK